MQPGTGGLAERDRDRATTATPSGQLTVSSPPSVSVTPADGAAGVGLDATIQVTAQNATLSSVAVLENGDSHTLAWVVSNGNTEWAYAGASTSTPPTRSTPPR